MNKQKFIERQEAMQRHANYYFTLLFNNGIKSDGDIRNLRLAYSRLLNGKVTTHYDHNKIGSALMELLP